MEVHLTSHDWKKLKGFVDGEGDHRKADIHDILVGMTIDIFYFNQTRVLEWLGEQINFSSPGIVLALMSVLVLSVVFSVGMYSDLYWNRRFLGCLLLAIFVISLIWNWIYLYQEETIKRYRSAQKYEDIPPNCMPSTMTWVQSLSEWYRTTMTVKTDPCFDYHRLYLVDPLLDIPPTRALSFTVSSFFVDPMKYLGRAFGEFHAELFGRLPFWLGFLALCSFYVVVFVALYAYIVAPRRVLREPYVLGRIPAGGQHKALRGGLRPEMQVQEQYREALEDDPGRHEGDRVENVPLPTLPPMVQEEQRPHEVPADPPGNGGHQVPADPASGAQPKASGARRRVNEKSHHPFKLEDGDQAGPRGCAAQYPLNRSTEADGDHTRQSEPVVRPKMRSARMQQQVDGNETDVSSLSSMEASKIQRPSRLPESASSRTKPAPMQRYERTSSVGDTDSGTVVTHPASERSDVESLVSSVADPTAVQEPEASVCYGGDPSQGMDSTTGYASPGSADSPSDISVISPSPENTNSASYDFISTSCISLGEGMQSLPSEDHQEDQLGNDDDDEEFVVLEKESH